MTIQVEISSETEAWLVTQAASQSVEVPTFAASLLEQAKRPTDRESPQLAAQPRHSRPDGRKSLAQLFDESPFKSLTLDFERDRDFG